MTTIKNEGSPRVLFAAFEAVPFAKTGGLGDVAGSLPKTLVQNGADVRVIMPKLQDIPEKYKKQMTHVADFYFYLAWRNLYCGIETLELNGVTFYFIDNEYYFKRSGVYGFGDDSERAAFFAKAVLESLRYLDFCPQIIHCNDWHTSLIPSFLKIFYQDCIMGSALADELPANDENGKPYDRAYRSLRTVFTVHNLKFQGVFSPYLAIDTLGFNMEEADSCGLMHNNAINFMRGALCLSDRLTTVSPTYAGEICTDFYGEDCQDIFRYRNGVLSGIMNGIDTSVLDPETDPNLPAHYSIDDPEHIFPEKGKVKAALQERLGLEVNPDKPIYAIISRLTDQKGLDLVLGIIDEFMQLDVQFVVLGVGEHKYEEKFRQMGEFMPSKFAAALYFDEGLSRMIYAGADFILVPSLFEPCGLTQITAMRYGSLPIVRETGGLKDSVIPYNRFDGSGTGFSFANYNAHELLFKMKDALDLYTNDRVAFNQLILQAMAVDYSWNASAAKYAELYKELI